MALSDAPTLPAQWSTDTMLNSKVQAPRFLRTQWDEATAQAFGPWRIAEKPEPTDGLMTEATRLAVHPTETDSPSPAEGEQDTLEAAPQGNPTESPWSEAALQQLRDEAYERGLLEGQAQVRNEFENERGKERELIRHLGIELRSISQDPQRFFEPLKRLSLHIAEQREFEFHAVDPATPAFGGGQGAGGASQYVGEHTVQCLWQVVSTAQLMHQAHAMRGSCVHASA